MRKALLATSAIVGFALATYACGGDDDTNPAIPTPTKDAGKTSSSSGNSSSGNSSSGSSGTTSSSSGTSGTTSSSSSSGTSGTSGTTSSGGTPPIDDAGSVKDGSAISDSGTPDASESDGSAGNLCQVGSIQETEVNDSEVNADVITGDHAKFCGTASTSDTDYITFTMPVDANTFSIAVNTSDALLLTGTINGAQPFALTGQDAGASVPFVPGGKYVLTATTTVAKSDYIIAVDITHSPAATTCVGNSTKEAEDNGTTANTMAITGADSSFCGTINTTGDTDKFSFTMPTVGTFATKFSTTGQGFKLILAIEGEAQTIDLSAPNVGEIPYHAGKLYSLTATSTTANNGYVFHLTTTP